MSEIIKKYPRVQDGQILAEEDLAKQQERLNDQLKNTVVDALKDIVPILSNRIEQQAKLNDKMMKRMLDQIDLVEALVKNRR